MTKIYICGQMSGIENYNFKKFDEVQQKLEKLGYEVVNPANLARELANKYRCSLDDIDRRDHLINDIKHLLQCDCLYTIQGWEKSKGAILEFHIALELNMRIIYETENL